MPSGSRRHEVARQVRFSQTFSKTFFARYHRLVQHRATIGDVAAAAGVSVATVSKAINGRYGVGSDTAARVLAVANELGYASSLGASSMRSSRTGVVGVFIAAFEPFSTEVMKGIGVALGGSGSDLLAYSSLTGNEHDGWERRSLSRLSGTLDGAILVAPTVVDLPGAIPLVAIDPHTGPAGLPTVDSDGFAGARLAVSHLVELGHRRIGFVAGRPDLRSALLREAGYRRALEDAGIPFDASLVRQGNYEQKTSREAATALLDLPERPTAVFAANDLSAIATVQVAQTRGLVVPRDLSVVGFDDVPEAARADPPLTTVRQSMQQLGNEAVAMLLALIAGQELRRPHVTLATRLVERRTTAPPAARPR
jgi:LacI family transcriptional regulator